MTSPGSLVTAVAMWLALTAPAELLAGRKNQKDQAVKRPRLTLRVQPPVAVSPARIVLTAELSGGPDDFEEYYCPTIEWEWGDDTRSEATSDCEPYVAGKTQIKRRFTVQHTFRRPGAYKVYFHMKRKDRLIASASATVQVHPGAVDSFRDFE
jgi:hypothetical protein